MIDKGFTKVGNEILEEIPKRKFNGTQLKIIMIIWRFTFGFHREEHQFSLTFLAEALGIDKSQIKKELTPLFDKAVLIETQKATFNSPRKIKFNVTYPQWKVEYNGQAHLQGTNQSTLNIKALTTIVGNVNSPVDKSVDTTVDKKIHQEINNINKSNISINKKLDFDEEIIF